MNFSRTIGFDLHGIQFVRNCLSGIPASQIFKDLREQDPAITAVQLMEILLTEFPAISPAACITINRWLGAGSVVIQDEDLDALISHYIKEAGYGS